MSLFPLRPLQQAALDGLRQSILAGKKRVVVQAPTGFGKTICAAHMAAGALAKGKRAAFVVPMISLIDQTFERFMSNGIDPADMGVMQAAHPWRRPHAPLQICSVQTLERRGFPDVSFAIIDEAHVRFRAIDRWLSTRPDVLFFGLSATPWSKGMGEVWDDLIVPATLADLIEQGWLAKFRVFAAAKPDLSGVKIVAGEYHEGQLSEVMSGRQIVADVVSTWLAKGEGRQTLMFAVDRAHAATLHGQFNDAGVACEYVDGETPREERLKILARYSAGEVRVISSVATLTTGVDVPCQCIIDAAPTKSEIRHVQRIGRGLRIEPGKENVLIFDHGGNCLRLGLPTEIGRTTLRTAASDAREKARNDADDAPRAEPLPRECKCCGCLNPARSRTCEACGAEFKRASNVETLDGELVEIGAKARKAEPVIEKLRKMGKQAIYSQIVSLGDKRGWSSGRKSHFYRDIFGVWPRDLADVAASPSPELMSFEHAKRIAWTKGQAKARAAANSDARELANV